jgi:plasmid stabilization system protein ParE
LIRDIGVKIARLAEHPDLDRAVPAILVLYEIRPDTDVRPVDEVEIVRVVDGRRDLASLL